MRDIYPNEELQEEEKWRREPQLGLIYKFIPRSNPCLQGFRVHGINTQLPPAGLCHNNHTTKPARTLIRYDLKCPLSPSTTSCVRPWLCYIWLIQWFCFCCFSNNPHVCFLLVLQYFELEKNKKVQRSRTWPNTITPLLPSCGTYDVTTPNWYILEMFTYFLFGRFPSPVCGLVTDWSTVQGISCPPLMAAEAWLPD